jgi:hypothetical protein
VTPSDARIKPWRAAAPRLPLCQQLKAHAFFAQVPVDARRICPFKGPRRAIADDVKAVHVKFSAPDLVRFSCSAASEVLKQLPEFRNPRLGSMTTPDAHLSGPTCVFLPLIILISV